MPIKQQSALLSQQELKLLVSEESATNSANIFPIYSSVRLGTEWDYIYCDQLSSLVLWLETSPSGVVLILASSMEQEHEATELLSILKERADIKIFWLGELPSMEFDLPVFTHCVNRSQLKSYLQQWLDDTKRLFKNWQKQYQIGFITDNYKQPLISQLKKHSRLEILRVDQHWEKTLPNKLLVIDLNSKQLLLVNILRRLQQTSNLPFLLLYGDIPKNLSHAIFNLAKHLGFSVVACLTKTPSLQQCQQILLSVFRKTYLKPWLTEERNIQQAQTLIEVNSHKVDCTIFPYGMSKKQIRELNIPQSLCKVINTKSLRDWFPSGINQQQFFQLADDLGIKAHQLGFCIDDPQAIQYNSPIFYLLTMARLNNLRIFWHVQQEQSFSLDMLMFLPISDLLLNKALSKQLLEQPSNELLAFLEEAKQQDIQLSATIKNNKVSSSVLSIYGIQSLLAEH